MPVYGFRCSSCGDFDVLRPMAVVSSAEPCPSCAGTAVRLFTPPMVRRLAPDLRVAVDRSVASADRPDVVQAVPPSRSRSRGVSTDPRHAALPRP